MVESLSVQAAKHLSLQQLLDIGFERLPSSEEFFEALVKQIVPDFFDNYLETSWFDFEKDLLFITQNEGQPLNFPQGALFWRRQGNTYFVAKATVAAFDDSIYRFEALYTDDLESVIHHSLEVIWDNKNTIMDSIPIKRSKIKGPARKILQIMLSEKQKKVNKYLEHLQEGNTIEFEESPADLSLFPLTDISKGAILLEKEKLIIIGLFRSSGKGYLNKDLTFMTPNVMCYTGDDIPLVLSILSYNPSVTTFVHRVE